MTDKQPEALRLAAWADTFNTVQHDKTAAELRRLHASEAELLRALQAYMTGMATHADEDRARAAILSATKGQQ